MPRVIEYLRHVAPSPPAPATLSAAAIVSQSPVSVQNQIEREVAIDEAYQLVYYDFVQAKVKTVSLLAHFLRQMHVHLKDSYADQAPDVILGVFKQCPLTASTMRKELLTATHMVCKVFQKSFAPHVDRLLDKNLLIGDGYAAHVTLRPVAYQMVADVVHHLREHLTLEQLQRCVFLFARNIHDDSLPLKTQITCARLLMNMVECIVKHLPKPNEAPVDQNQLFLIRQLVLALANTMACKFLSLQYLVPQVQRLNEQENLREDHLFVPLIKKKEEEKDKKKGDGQQQQQQEKEKEKDVLVGEADDSKSSSSSIEEKESDDLLNHRLPQAFPARTPLLDEDEAVSVLYDQATSANLRSLIKTLLLAFKNSIWGLLHIAKSSHQAVNANAPPAFAAAHMSSSSTSAANGGNTSASASTLADAAAGGGGNVQSKVVYKLSSEFYPILEVMFDNALAVVDGSCAYADLPSDAKDQKDAIESFALIFATLDTSAFRTIVGARLPQLYQRLIKNPTLLSIVSVFLSIEDVSPDFCSMMLGYLGDLLPKLGSMDKTQSAILVRLYKHCFHSLSMPKNEVVVQPFVVPIVTSCLKYVQESKDSTNYFLVLRMFFRAVAANKFELLYKELLPLVPSLLHLLNRLKMSACMQSLKDVYVELALTIPVRHTHLIAFLPQLVHPLLWALESNSPDLITIGLRLMEGLVAQLSPQFLDPMLECVRSEILLALWRHVKPLSSGHAHGSQALKILGKLGGRNRDFTSFPENLDSQEIGELDKLSISVALEEGVCVQLPLDKCIRSARKFLILSPDVHLKKQGFLLLRVCLSAMLRVRPELDYERLEQLLAKGELPALPTLPPMPTTAAAAAAAASTAAPQPQSTTKKQLEGETSALRTVLKTIIMASAFATEELESYVGFFCDNVVRHFSLLCCLDPAPSSDAATTSSLSSSGLNEISPRVFLTAIVEVSTSETINYSVSGGKCIGWLVKTATELCGGSLHRASQFSVFSELTDSFCEQCFEPSWSKKSGGVMGLERLCATLDPQSFVIAHAVEIARALLFVIGDSEPELGLQVVEVAQETLSKIVGIVIGGDTTVNSNGDAKKEVDDDAASVEQPLKKAKKEPAAAAAAAADASSMDVESADNVDVDVEFDRTLHSGTASSVSMLAQMRLRAAEDVKLSPIVNREVFDAIVRMLVGSLAAPSEAARAAVHTLLERMAQADSCDVADLVAPLYSTIIAPMLAEIPKQTQNLPSLPEVRCGSIFAAVSYCMQLRPAVIPMNSSDFGHLITVLSATLVIGDENESLPPPSSSVYHANRLKHHQHRRHEAFVLLSAVIQLRNVHLHRSIPPARSIAVLVKESASSDDAEAATNTTTTTTSTTSTTRVNLLASSPLLDEDMRDKIVERLLKALTLSDQATVDVALQCLRNLQATNALPPKLLKFKMQPMFKQILEPVSLTVSLLRGIVHAVDLMPPLTFRIDLGQKLGDFLLIWKDRAKLNAHRLWRDGEDVHVATLMYEILARLPYRLEPLVPDIITTSYHIEQAMVRGHPMSYRRPLLRFLCNFPVKTVDSFMQIIESAVFSTYFVDLLRMEEAAPLRQCIASQTNRLVQSTFLHSSAIGMPRVSLGIDLVHALAIHDLEWLISPENAFVMEKVRQSWKLVLRKTADSSHLQRTSDVHMIYRIVHIFLMVVKRQRTKAIDFLFELALVMASYHGASHPYIVNFFEQQLRSYSIEERQYVVKKFLDFCSKDGGNEDQQAKIVEHLILPLFSMKQPSSSGAKDVFTPEIVSRACLLLLKQRLITGEGAQEAMESISQITDISMTAVVDKYRQLHKICSTMKTSLAVQLVKFCILLVKFIGPKEMGKDERKSMLVFAWFWSASNDVLIKHWSELLMTRYIATDVAPAQTAYRLYKSLLRASPVTSRILVQKAFDNIIPVVVGLADVEKQQLVATADGNAAAAVAAAAAAAATTSDSSSPLLFLPQYARISLKLLRSESHLAVAHMLSIACTISVIWFSIGETNGRRIRGNLAAIALLTPIWFTIERMRLYDRSHGHSLRKH